MRIVVPLPPCRPGLLTRADFRIKNRGCREVCPSCVCSCVCACRLTQSIPLNPFCGSFCLHPPASFDSYIPQTTACHNYVCCKGCCGGSCSLRMGGLHAPIFSVFSSNPCLGWKASCRCYVYSEGIRATKLHATHVKSTQQSEKNTEKQCTHVHRKRGNNELSRTREGCLIANIAKHDALHGKHGFFRFDKTSCLNIHGPSKYSCIQIHENHS